MSRLSGRRLAMAEGRSREALIAQALGTVLDRDVAITECSLLGGSTGKRSFRVAAEGEQYVVRLGDGLYGETLDLEEEADLMRAAAVAGLAPEVVGTDPATGTLVTRWLAGAQVWTERTARRPREIARIAALLRKLHALNVRLPPFEARQVARRYISEAHRRRPQDTDTETAELARELTTLAERYDDRFPPTAICHNDLVAANILDTGELKHVDFEYAVRAAPVLDLASLAAMNRMDAGQRRLLVETYCPDGRAPFSEDEFKRVVRMVNLITLFWARSQDDESQRTIPEYADPARLLDEQP